jgi:hypothetical protein
VLGCDTVGNTSGWSTARQLPSFWTLSELRHTLQQTVSSRPTDKWHVMLRWRRKPFLIALGSSTGRAQLESYVVSVQPNLLCQDDAEFKCMQICFRSRRSRRTVLEGISLSRRFWHVPTSAGSRYFVLRREVRGSGSKWCGTMDAFESQQVVACIGTLSCVWNSNTSQPACCPIQ